MVGEAGLGRWLAKRGSEAGSLRRDDFPDMIRVGVKQPNLTSFRTLSHTYQPTMNCPG